VQIEEIITTMNESRTIKSFQRDILERYLSIPILMYYGIAITFNSRKRKKIRVLRKEELGFEKRTD